MLLPAVLALFAPTLPAAQSPPEPASVVLYTAHDGLQQLLRLELATGDLSPLLEDVTLLDIALLGYPVKDVWRADAPSLRGATEGRGHVRLPDGGSIYRVAHAGADVLLQLAGDGSARLALATPGDVLDPRVHVAPDGSLLATSTVAGHVYVLDLATGEVTRATLAAHPDLSRDSLRVSRAGLWFVAGGTLWRGAPQGTADPVPLADDEPVEAELALAANGGAVAAITRQSDGKGQIHHVPATGAATLLESHPERYSAPGYAHPLGPFLTLSPDGVLLAYRRENGDRHELYVGRLDAPDREHLTVGELFPAYVDNVGVFAFAGPRRLCFFGGDQGVSGVDPTVEFGNADMYVADLSMPGSPHVFNLTRTNGQSSPPFDVVPDLWIERVWVGANAEQTYIYGREDGGAPRLASFRSNGTDPREENLTPLLSGLDGAPIVLALAEGAVLMGRRREADPPFSQAPDHVECAGDAMDLPLVRLRASDREDFSDPGADVWFDDWVEPGALVDIDAAAMGKTKLDSDTWVHVFDTAGTLRQSISLHTSCSQPLRIGDRFGAVRIVSALGEDEGQAVEGDACAGGSDPAWLLLRYQPAGCEPGGHQQDPERVECSGDPSGHGLVHVRASNDADPGALDARIWFDADLLAGADLELDAGSAQRTKLDSLTWLHVSAPGGAHLQSVRFDTSCSEPLVPGDRFGSFVLRDVRLEDGGGVGDACANGRPRRLTVLYGGHGCDPITFGPKLYVARGLAATAMGSVAPRLTSILDFPRRARVERAAASYASGQAALIVERPGARASLVSVDAASGRAVEIDRAELLSSPAYSADGTLLYARSDGGGKWELCIAAGAEVRVAAVRSGRFEVLD